MSFLIWILFYPCIIKSTYAAEKQCAVRNVDGESVVCVCNSTYCDNVVRDIPNSGTYVTYTTSKDGLRFQKTTGTIDSISNISSTCCSVTLVLDVKKKFQKIEGFGGAVTDSASINWLTLSTQTRQQLINSYFSEEGLQYNMIRVPIGGSDFSTHPYAYNEIPVNDHQLSNYTLTKEDTKYKIPMIKECMQATKTPIHIVAATWSPPVWMKTNGKYTGASRLKEEYYDAYASYHLKFIELYDAKGIRIWAISTTNEPINGVIPIVKFNSLGWTPSGLAKWVVNSLGPTIRNSTYSATKILAVDDQRYTIPVWFGGMIESDRSVLDYLDGVAVHYYGDYFTPAAVLTWVTDKYPDKFVLATEACEGSFPWEFQKVLVGSWKRAENYIKDIITDLNHSVIGWIDWNLCLDEKGGPNWADNFVDSAIIVYGNRDEFIKQPMFYAIGHFSKFIPRGSQRIAVNRRSIATVDHVAFLTPSDTIVVVLYNRSGTRIIRLIIGEKAIVLKMKAYSVTTAELKLST